MADLSLYAGYCGPTTLVELGISKVVRSLAFEAGSSLLPPSRSVEITTGTIISNPGQLTGRLT